MGAIVDGLVDEDTHGIDQEPVGHARACRHRISGGGLVAVQRGVGSDARVGGHQQGRHVSAVAYTSGRVFDGAAALVDDVGTGQFGGAGIHGAVDECDGDALACVALLACSVQVVVREVLLGGDRVRRVRGRRSQGEGADGQRECGGGGGQGARGAPRPPHKTEGRTGRGLGGDAHHWRGSHPSSLRFAGVMSLSVPEVCDRGFT